MLLVARLVVVERPDGIGWLSVGRHLRRLLMLKVMLRPPHGALFQEQPPINCYQAHVVALALGLLLVPIERIIQRVALGRLVALYLKLIVRAHLGPTQTLQMLLLGAIWMAVELVGCVSMFQ